MTSSLEEQDADAGAGDPALLGAAESRGPSSSANPTLAQASANPQSTQASPNPPLPQATNPPPPQTRSPPAPLTPTSHPGSPASSAPGSAPGPSAATSLANAPTMPPTAEHRGHPPPYLASARVAYADPPRPTGLDDRMPLVPDVARSSSSGQAAPGRSWPSTNPFSQSSGFSNPSNLSVSGSSSNSFNQSSGSSNSFNLHGSSWGSSAPGPAPSSSTDPSSAAPSHAQAGPLPTKSRSIFADRAHAARGIDVPEPNPYGDIRHGHGGHDFSTTTTGLIEDLPWLWGPQAPSQFRRRESGAREAPDADDIFAPRRRHSRSQQTPSPRTSPRTSTRRLSSGSGVDPTSPSMSARHAQHSPRSPTLPSRAAVLGGAAVPLPTTLHAGVHPTLVQLVQEQWSDSLRLALSADYDDSDTGTGGLFDVLLPELPALVPLLDVERVREMWVRQLRALQDE